MKKLIGLGLLLLQFSSYAQDWKAQIIEDTRVLYSPVAITGFNKPLEIKIDDSATVGAAADHTDLSVKLIIYKGLLESPRLTPDGL